MSAKKLTPGTKAPASAQYEIIGPRGGHTRVERTGVRGKPLPPTPNAGETYQIVDRTKNAAGKGN